MVARAQRSFALSAEFNRRDAYTLLMADIEERGERCQ